MIYHPSRRMAGFLLATLTVIASGQTEPAATTKSTTSPPGAGAYNYAFFAGLTCGGGATTSSSAPSVAAATKPTAQCGGIFGGPLLHFETGVMGPQANHSSVSGYLSVNTSLPLLPGSIGKKSRLQGLPLIVGGYTRMFETGHALDHGLAYALPIDDAHSVQFEVRDYWTFSNPTQHNAVFRVVLLTGLPD